MWAELYILTKVAVDGPDAGGWHSLQLVALRARGDALDALDGLLIEEVLENTDHLLHLLITLSLNHLRATSKLFDKALLKDSLEHGLTINLFTILVVRAKELRHVLSQEDRQNIVKGERQPFHRDRNHSKLTCSLQYSSGQVRSLSEYFCLSMTLLQM